MPQVDLACVSFPCVDLSLAGARQGLNGRDSGMYWEFVRIVDEMGDSRPRSILIENVQGFVSSSQGRDLESAIHSLNRLGYTCDAFVVDARHFVPQSRKRLFVVAWQGQPEVSESWIPSVLRPAWLCDFMNSRPSLGTVALPLAPLPLEPRSVSEIVELLDPADDLWWDAARTSRFAESLSELQSARLESLVSGFDLSWRTAYRRTRLGVARWEIRRDTIAGCLRTTKGGSSKQALVEAGRGELRIRWMTAREYARLQGVSDDYIIDGVRPNQALYAFGDAVCVPVVSWIARNYLTPLLSGGLLRDGRSS